MTAEATTSSSVIAVKPWPTMAETLPGFSAAPNVFLVAPAATPPAVVQKLSSTLRSGMTSKDVEESLAKQGATATPSSSAELAGQIADEVKRWATVVRDAGIKVE